MSSEFNFSGNAKAIKTVLVDYMGLTLAEIEKKAPKLNVKGILAGEKTVPEKDYTTLCRSFGVSACTTMKYLAESVSNIFKDSKDMAKGFRIYVEKHKSQKTALAETLFPDAKEPLKVLEAHLKIKNFTRPEAGNLLRRLGHIRFVDFFESVSLRGENSTYVRLRLVSAFPTKEKECRAQQRTRLKVVEEKALASTQETGSVLNDFMSRYSGSNPPLLRR